MLLVCLIWGLNFSVTKSRSTQIPPLAVHRHPFRHLQPPALAGAAGGGGTGASSSAVPEAPGDPGLVGNTFYQLAFTVGLSRTTATNSALILSTVPTVVAVFAGVLGLERITPRMWLGIALGTLGVVLVIATRGVGFDRGTFAGDLLTVLAVLCWAGYTVGLRRVPAGRQPAPGHHHHHHRRHARTGAGRAARHAAAGLGRGQLEGLAGGGLCAVLSLVVAYLLWNRSVKAVGGDPHGHLHVSHAAGCGARSLAAPGRAAPPAPGGGRDLHRRGSVADDGQEKAADGDVSVGTVRLRYCSLPATFYHNLLVALRLPLRPLGAFPISWPR